MDWIQQYKKRVLSRLISVEPSKLKEKIIDSEYYLVSEKIDGFYTVMVVSANGISLYNKSGRELKIPGIQQLKFAQPCVLVGELCVFENDRPQTHRELSSAIAKPADKDIRFAAFDIIELNGKSVEGDAVEKYRVLSSVANQTSCFTITQEQVTSRTEVEDFYNKINSNEGEGIIVKAANEMAYKIKPIITLDLVVLGFCEGIQEKAGVVRDLLLGVALENNEYQVVGSVGTGLSNADRSSFYEALAANEVSSSYTEVSGAKTAFVMVKPEWVVEVSCLDILADNSQGSIKKTILTYGTSGYDVKELTTGVSLVSAVFIRKRTDKTVGVAHTGMQQLSDFLIPSATEAHPKQLVDSQIVLREVYTKENKNGKMVRKILGLKTNKEDTDLFPPFLVLYTDFSAGRAEPMDQEITWCSSQSGMQDKVTALRAEYIKGGWNKVN
jgi:ATP-dependent DNA ligase